MTALLMTGAAGRIGRVLRTALREDVDELRLVDREPLEPETPHERFHAADLRDYDAVRDLAAGVDAIVHLAAISGEAPFSDVLDTNIRATFHVLEAARRRDVPRVVLASSNHATGMYPPSRRIGPDDPPRPDGFYGVGKACDEALGRLYVDKFGLEVACLRIGSFQERPRSERELATWLSHRDAVHLFRRCLEVPDLGFAIVYGVSANTRSWWDNPEAERIGYHPVDDAEDHADAIEPPPPEWTDQVARSRAFQGGPFALPDASDFPPPRTSEGATLDLLEAVRTIAQTGLHYAEDPFDRQRYEQLLDLAAGSYADLAGLPSKEVRRRFADEVGHATAKVGAEAAVFDEDGRILLVRRTDDGTWCLPCGWVEPGESPAEAAARETREETGLEVEAGPLVDVFTRHASVDRPHTQIAVLYLCELVGGQPRTSIETTEVAFRAIDEVDDWHPGHEEYAEAALAARRHDRA